ncbi:hypothetical protein RND81_07G042000 [Saponaria officinalis]|uniref:Phytocyanin domain-containing protein n=1 Tax=Saponaria officinalis TaxID=3572 RepID=A0AAW1JM86_SAPOF
MAFVTAFLVMLLATPFAFAIAQTTVDWTIGKSYSSYSTQSLKPGGTILFNYDKTLHNVEIVSKSDYENCVTGNALETFNDGKTSITLKQGAMYFICGIPGHCKGGMKLQVNVGDSSSSSTPATSTTPTPTTPSAPTPKDSSGTGTHSSLLMSSAFLVFGALFAILS